MNKYLVIFSVLALTFNMQAQTRYFQAYQVQFYDGNFNLLESNYCDKIIKISDSNHTLIIGGGMAFQFYGLVNIEYDNTISQMARPDDGSDDCRIFLKATSSNTTRITIMWTNMIVVYNCKN